MLLAVLGSVVTLFNPTGLDVSTWTTRSSGDERPPALAVRRAVLASNVIVGCLLLR